MSAIQAISPGGERISLDESTIQAFQASLRGKLLKAGDAGYEEARKIWNAMVDKKPALIARCTGAADVMSCVKFAREHNLLVAVRGGGHNIAGHASCNDGLLVDLSQMRSVRVDPVNRTVRAEPGVTLGELDRETQAFGLATTGGVVSTTGIAGLTLGGGIGWQMRQHGLACDNLVSADVVTADGQFLVASATQNADLFWGLRGGGGNLGIVTSFEYRLHATGPIVLGGMLIHPLQRAKEVLSLYREFVRTAPDQLGSAAALMTSPDGIPVVVIIAAYFGDIAEGEKILKPLREFGPPVADVIQPMPYTVLQSMLDAAYAPGFQNYWKSNFLKELSDEVIDIAATRCADRPFPLCHMVIEHMGGAVARVAPDATAFGHRDATFNFLILGCCPEPSLAQACKEWARGAWEAVRKHASDGAYVNYLGQEDDEGAERVVSAYGQKNYEQLAALKKKYDPTNFFRLNQNIKPSV